MDRNYYPTPYMQLSELHAPAPLAYQHYATPQASSSLASYDMTPGESACGSDGVPRPALPSGNPRSHEARKRRSSHFSDDYDAMSGSDRSGAPQAASMSAPSSRRRKGSSYGTASAYDDDSEGSRSTKQDKNRQNHSEIEKRRRDKMNTYISELSAIIPMCGAMARKLDKLTVLRMAVQHMRIVCGALSACPLMAYPRPAYVTACELNELVLATGRDAIVLVVGCDRGRLLYVSTSVTAMLHYDKSELLGQSLFDILHPKDVAKVKEQLSSSDLSPRERLIDAKTMLPVKAETGGTASRLCPGARRSFFCRIKAKGIGGSNAPAATAAPPTPAAPATPATPNAPATPAVKEELDPGANLRKKHERKYCVVQFTGYLKSWAPAEIHEDGDGACDGVEDDNLSCLVAVGRALVDLAPAAAAPLAPPAPTMPTRPLQFLSRHANDGKYLFVDQRVTLALGFLPQELLGTSLYEYVSGPELAAVARAHKAALAQRSVLRTSPYAVRSKDGSQVLLQTRFKSFKNPWTKDVESLLAENTVVTNSGARSPFDSSPHAEDGHDGASTSAAGAEYDAEVQRLIESQVESHNIGSAIAEEALRRSPSAAFTLDLPSDLLNDAFFSNPCLVETMNLDEQPVDDQQVRNNVTLSAAADGAQSPGEGPGSPSSVALDGNGEAAMAVIMSLLEADAGLGGPVNFASLPWPLP